MSFSENHVDFFLQREIVKRLDYESLRTLKENSAFWRQEINGSRRAFARKEVDTATVSTEFGDVFITLTPDNEEINNNFAQEICAKELILREGRDNRMTVPTIWAPDILGITYRSLRTEMGLGLARFKNLTQLKLVTDQRLELANLLFNLASMRELIIEIASKKGQGVLVTENDILRIAQESEKLTKLVVEKAIVEGDELFSMISFFKLMTALEKSGASCMKEGARPKILTGIDVDVHLELGKFLWTTATIESYMSRNGIELERFETRRYPPIIESITHYPNQMMYTRRPKGVVVQLKFLGNSPL